MSPKPGRAVTRYKAIAAAALFPTIALAEPVFFDDFAGPELLPHWSTPPGSHWDYNFNNNMLNITDLHYPNIPHIGGNWATFGASYAPQADFRADIWMGWDPGDDPHRLALYIMTPSGHNVASFAYRNEAWTGPTPVISAGAGGQAIHKPAPGPGIHHFTITRTGTHVAFFLNSEPFAAFEDVFGMPAGILSIESMGVGPLPGRFGTLYVDRVQIVPAPASWLWIAAVTVCCARRRR